MRVIKKSVHQLVHWRERLQWDKISPPHQSIGTKTSVLPGIYCDLSGPASKEL